MTFKPCYAWPLIGSLAIAMAAGLPFLHAITKADDFYGHHNPQAVPSLPRAPVPEGGINLVFFGYGSCTRTCPTQLVNLLELQGRIDQEPIQFVYVDLGSADDRIPDLGSSIERWGDAFTGYAPATFHEAQQLALAYGGFVARRGTATGQTDALNHDGRLHVVTEGNVRVLAYPPAALDVNAVLNDLHTLMATY